MKRSYLTCRMRAGCTDVRTLLKLEEGRRDAVKIRGSSEGVVEAIV